MNLTVKLTKEEIKRLEEVKNRDNYLIISIRTEEGIEIGLIELNIINLRDREGYIKSDYYKMTFRLGSNPEDELIKYTAIPEYTLRQSEIDKVLFGEHLLINTVNGKRMVLTVQK